MNTELFAPFNSLLSGLFVGIVFGFLLRKAHVTRFKIIVGQLLLTDFTVMKVMLTAIGFGSFGIYTLMYFLPGYTLLISSTTLLAAFLGGSIFGIGMATMGYCPGTGVGALADGAREMWFGLLGMIVGAALYAESYGWISQYIKPAEDINKTTIPALLGVWPLIISVIVFIMLIAIAYAERRYQSR